MERNMTVKNNVDDMIYQVLNYIYYSNLPDDEVETLVFEILSTIMLWDCDWNPEKVDMASIVKQINNIFLKLSIAIPQNLIESLEQNGYRTTGE